MKSRTNKQVFDFSLRLLKRYQNNSEKFRERIFNYWVSYRLTDVQCRYLEELKNRVRMPDWSLDED